MDLRASLARRSLQRPTGTSDPGTPRRRLLQTALRVGPGGPRRRLRGTALALVVGVAGCSFTASTVPDLPDAPAAASMIEWLGDTRLRSNGYFIQPEHVIAGQPLDVCARAYPVGAVARATLVLEDRELAMQLDAEGVGPFAHDTRWCAPIAGAELVDGRSIVARVVAADAAGVLVEDLPLAITPRAEIALDGQPAAGAPAVWRMAGPGAFSWEGEVVRAHPSGGLGLYWPAIPTPADFELSLEWQLDRLDDNSGVFVRFRDPKPFDYDNPAWVAIHDGLEIQIDETARPDGADIHRTGAVYDQPGQYTRAPDRSPGVWRPFAIRVIGARVTVALDGEQVSDVTFGGDPVHPQRALPSAPGAPRFIGLQSHTGVVAFRRIRLRAL